ncbi:unnamed protein product [Parajaminaea phylloscopi]
MTLVAAAAAPALRITTGTRPSTDDASHRLQLLPGFDIFNASPSPSSSLDRPVSPRSLPASASVNAAARASPTSPAAAAAAAADAPRTPPRAPALLSPSNGHAAVAADHRLSPSPSLPTLASPGHRRGSVASSTSSFRVRRKAVPSESDLARSVSPSPSSVMGSRALSPDRNGLAPSPVAGVRRRSSAHSNGTTGRPTTAPVAAPDAGIQDGPVEEITPAPAATYDSLVSSRNGSSVDSQAQAGPSSLSAAAKTRALSRPSTAPTDPVSAPPLRPARDTIMVDGQAFILGGTADEDDAEQQQGSAFDDFAALRRHHTSTAPAAPTTWSGPAPARTALSRHVDLSVHSKAAEERERAMQERRRVTAPSQPAGPPPSSTFQWHRSSKEHREELRRGSTGGVDDDAHIRSLVRDLGQPARASRRPNTAMGIVKATRRGKPSTSSSSNGHGNGHDSRSSASLDAPAGAYAIQPPSHAALSEAANLMLYTEDGSLARFGELFAQRRTLVCFLRHWFCPMCQEFAMSMKNLDPLPLRQANMGLVVIGQGHPHVISAYKRVMGVPQWIRMYADPSRRVYRALGMTMRTNDPGPACAKPDYIQMGMLKGSMTAIKKSLFEMPLRSPGDLKLLGGEFVLGPGVQCSFVHRMVTTRGHLDIPRVLTQAGCDMTLQSPRGIEDEESRPASVKSAGGRLKGRRSTPFKSVRQIARNFEQDRRRLAGTMSGSSSDKRPSSRASALRADPIPAVPKLPPAAALFQHRPGAGAGAGAGVVANGMVAAAAATAAPTPAALMAAGPKRFSGESSDRRSESSSRTSLIMARGPQPQGDAVQPPRHKMSWLAAPAQTIKRAASVPDLAAANAAATNNGAGTSSLDQSQSRLRPTQTPVLPLAAPAPNGARETSPGPSSPGPSSTSTTPTRARSTLTSRVLTPSDGRPSYSTSMRESLDALSVRKEMSVRGSTQTQSPGIGSFLTDLDVVDDLIHRIEPQKQAGRTGATNRDTFASEDFDGYRTSLDSWRSGPISEVSEEGEAARSDSDDLEHGSGWTRPASASQQRRVEKPPRESMESEYTEYSSDQTEGRRDGEDSSRGSSASYTESDGRSTPRGEDDSEGSEDSTTVRSRDARDARDAAGVGLSSAPSLHSHTGHRFGHEDAILEEDEPGSGSGSDSDSDSDDSDERERATRRPSETA